MEQTTGVAFANENPENLDPVSHAALIHAQFEAIHPYGDGNGRLGRVPVSRTLRRWGVASRSTALLAQWGEATSGLRSDHSAHALLPHLPAHPLLSAGDVADLLDISERSARTALAALADCGVLSPIDLETPSPGRNRHWFTAPDLLNIWRA